MKGETDVLIVGAGPVGLFLTIELQRRGVDHVLIEQKPAPSYFVKALGISPRTLEIWEQIGLAREAIDAGLFLRGVAMLVNGELSTRVPVPEGRYPYGPLVLAQFETERLLRSHLARIGGAVHAGLALTGFDARDDGVLARVADAGGAERVIACRYLVGCDGAHSVVRHGLGLAYEGDAYPMTFLLGDVAVDWIEPRGWAYRGVHVVDGQVRNGMAAIPIPGDPRRYRLSLAAPDRYAGEGVDLATPPTLDLLAGAVAPMLPAGASISNLRWSSFYRISHRIVPRYGVGRVFVAGDAAHIHPPIGGQGMNTGLQDAFNLGWKLSLAAQGLAAPDLLESYTAERQPVGLQVVTRTSARMGRTIEGKDQEGADEMDADSQLFVSYRGSGWVGEDADRSFDGGPRPGDRAPDASGLGQPYLARPMRLAELFRGTGHTLLAYVDAAQTDADFRALATLADDLRATYGDALTTYAIAAPDARPLDLERIPILVDREERFRSTYGSTRASLYLIRPDGHVAYRAAPPDVTRLGAYLGRIFSSKR